MTFSVGLLDIVDTHSCHFHEVPPFGDMEIGWRRRKDYRQPLYVVQQQESAPSVLISLLPQKWKWTPVINYPLP